MTHKKVTNYYVKFSRKNSKISLAYLVILCRKERTFDLTDEDDVAEFPAAGAHHGRVVVHRVDEEHADVGENAADGEGDGADRPLGRRPQVLKAGRQERVPFNSDLKFSTRPRGFGVRSGELLSWTKIFGKIVKKSHNHVKAF